MENPGFRDLFDAFGLLGARKLERTQINSKGRVAKLDAVKDLLLNGSDF